MTRRGTAARLALLVVLPYLVLGLVWALANPAMAAPDEDAHLVKALGAARFDIGVPAPPTSSSDLGEVRNASIARVVEIPGRLDPTGYACTAFRDDVTAACQPAAPTAGGEVPVRTTLGAYPPFLYPPLGWAAGLGDDPVSADRWGRLLVLATSALLLWLAVQHVVRWLGARSLVGVAVLLSPMAVFCLGILGTSAAEVLGALGMAAVVAVYARRPESLAATGTQVVVLVSGTALVLSRQLGVVAMAALTLVLLALGGWREVWAGLRARRVMSGTTVAVLALATLAVGVWELRYDHPVLLGPWLGADSLAAYVAQLPQLVMESVGWFGWLDVRPPPVVYLVWFAAGALLVAVAVVLGDRRDRVVILGGLVVVLVVGYVTYARVFHPIGAGLQGRHLLPLLALVPLWAGVVVAERLPVRALARAVRVGAVLLPLVVLTGLLLNARRYAVGLGPDSPWWFVPDARWTPPLGWYPWLLLSLLGSVALGVVWDRVLRAGPDPGGGRLRDDPVGSPIPRS